MVHKNALEWSTRAKAIEFQHVWHQRSIQVATTAPPVQISNSCTNPVTTSSTLAPNLDSGSNHCGSRSSNLARVVALAVVELLLISSSWLVCGHSGNLECNYLFHFGGVLPSNLNYLAFKCHVSEFFSLHLSTAITPWLFLPQML